MAPINVVAHASAIGVQILLHVTAVGTVASVIATTVTMTVVITVIMKNLSGPDNALISHTVIVKSESKLAFNRDISSYELDYYFNATETLFTVVDKINNHLEDVFPDHFIKIILSEFSRKPETQFLAIRKRRNRPYGNSGEEPSYTTYGPTISTTTESSSSSKESSTTTTTSSMFSTVSTLFSSITTITSKPFSTTDAATAYFQTNHVSNCTISKFNDTKRPSLIYAYGNLYFNVTKTSDITIPNIIDALKKIFPSIKLIDVCGNPSSANGYFNITRSYISPITETNLTEADLNTMNSIPLDLLNEMNGVTPPSITTESISIPTILSTVTTNSISLVTTETTAQTSSIMTSTQTDSTSITPKTTTQTDSTPVTPEITTQTDSTSTTTTITAAMNSTTTTITAAMNSTTTTITAAMNSTTTTITAAMNSTTTTITAAMNSTTTIVETTATIT